MSLASLCFSDDPTHKETKMEVFSINELDTYLDKISQSCPADRPRLVIVIRSNGDTLGIGLGKAILLDDKGNKTREPFSESISALSFVSKDGLPPYYVGSTAKPALGNIVFFLSGHWTEFRAEHTVEMREAREAVRQFVTSEGLPSNVSWQEI